MDAIDDWKQQGDYFEFQSHKIFYSVRGDEANPTLLLIHGFPTSSYDWRHLLPVLDRQFFVISLDLIGYGLSDKPANIEYSFGLQADIIERLLSMLAIESYHILAHDYGDTVAQELLARDLEEERETIRSVILLNGGIIPETQNPVLLQRLLLGPLGNLVAKLTNYKRFKKNFDKICAVNLPESELQDYWQLMSLNNGLKRIPKIIQYIKERKQNRDRFVGALENARCPLRFINGLQDPVSGAQMVAQYKALVPAPDVIELADIGHYPQVESPERVANAANEFWQTHIRYAHLGESINIDEDAKLEL